MSGIDTDALKGYRASPLHFPIHAVEDDGTALCKSLTDDHRRFIENRGLESLRTLADRRDDAGWNDYKPELCGNCRRALESRHGETE